MDIVAQNSESQPAHADESEIYCQAFPIRTAKSAGEETKSWQELCDFLTKVVPTDDPKLQLPAWAPYRAKAAGLPRCADSVDVVTAGVLDCDHFTDDQRDQLRERLKGIAHCAHSTYSHKPVSGERCYRVVVQFDKPVPGKVWKRFHRVFSNMFGGANDSRCSDPARLYFMPFYPAGGPEPEFWIGEGEPLPVDQVLSAAQDRRDSARPPAPLAPAITRADIERWIATKSTARREDIKQDRDLFVRLLDQHPLARAGEGKRHDAVLVATRALVQRFPGIGWELVAELIKPTYTAEEWDSGCEQETRNAYEGALAKFSPLATTDDRQGIEVGSDLFETEGAATRALANHPGVFSRAGQLCCVSSDGAVSALGVHSLRSELSRVACFKQRRPTGDAANPVQWAPIEPPEDVARAILERGAWPGIRTIEAVYHHPVLLPDGRTFAAPGYDSASRTFYAPRATYEIPAALTRADALAALERYCRPYLEYVGGDISDPRLSVLVSAALTGIARPAIKGPIPATMIDGEGNGLGKTTAAQKIAADNTGTHVTIAKYNARREETEKRLFPVIREARTAWILDNVPPDAKAGDGEEFTAAITAWPEYSGRELGRNSSVVSMPNRTHFILTGKQILLAGDGFTDRLNYVRFDRELATRDEYPSAWIVEHHAHRVHDALTILLAYVQAGQPKQDMLPWRFTAWSDLVRGALIWLGMSDPRVTSQDLKPADAENHAALVHALHDRFGEAPFRAQQIDDLPQQHNIMRALRECGYVHDKSARAIGRQLRAASYAWFDDLRLVKGPKANGLQQWKIERRAA